MASIRVPIKCKSGLEHEQEIALKRRARNCLKHWFDNIRGTRSLVTPAFVSPLRPAVPVLPEADRRRYEPSLEQQVVFGLRQEPIPALLRPRPERVALDRRPADAALHEGSPPRRIQRRGAGKCATRTILSPKEHPETACVLLAIIQGSDGRVLLLLVRRVERLTL